MAKLSERVPPSEKVPDRKDVKVGDIVRVTMTNEELKESCRYQGCLTLGDEVTVTYMYGSYARLANEGEGCYLEIDSPAFELVVDKDEGTEDNTPEHKVYQAKDVEVSIGGKPILVDNPTISSVGYRGEGDAWRDIDLKHTVAPTIHNIEIKGTWAFPEDTTKETLNKTGVQTMTTLSKVNLTLIDTNENVRGKDKVVFSKEGYLTEYNQTDTIQNLLMEGDVKVALGKHNLDVRAKTLDKALLKQHGRDVKLDPIELISDKQLEWKYIIVG